MSSSSSSDSDSDSDIKAVISDSVWVPPTITTTKNVPKMDEDQIVHVSFI